MIRTTLRCFVFASVTLLALGAVAQPRRNRRRTPAPAADAGFVAPPPSANPELISVPVGDIDRMLRQMRVWLLTPPPGATGYGLGLLGNGHRLWALLPSCRQPHPDDPRDPCAVDRVIIEAVGTDGSISISQMDPIGLQPGAESRRVQSFTIPAGVPRIRVKLIGRNNHLRYEAVVDTHRLVEIPAAQGTPSANGFNFDLTQYPSR